jgi:Trm5-related predicted tRNA methylase
MKTIKIQKHADAGILFDLKEQEDLIYKFEQTVRPFEELYFAHEGDDEEYDHPEFDQIRMALQSLRNHVEKEKQKIREDLRHKESLETGRRNKFEIV